MCVCVCVLLNAMESIKARNYVYSRTRATRIIKYYVAGAHGARVQHVATQFYYVYYTLLTVNWTVLCENGLTGGFEKGEGELLHASPCH